MKVNNNNQHSDDGSLLVDISDALSERDRVRFTVHTRTKLPQFSKPVLSVVRQHEEFIWLHDCLADNDQYAGHIIPPPPPKPDFDASREKLQRLGDSESQLTKDEFTKMKQELEAEYLAIFKKTVAMHEMFLQRLAAHEKFREDNNFKIFLEYENELAVRGKSKREKLAGSLQNIGRSLTDFVITTSQVANTHSLGLGTSTSSGSNSNYNISAISAPPGAGGVGDSNSGSCLTANNYDNSGNVFNNNNINRYSDNITTSENVNVGRNINASNIDGSRTATTTTKQLPLDNGAHNNKSVDDKNHSNMSFSTTTTTTTAPPTSTSSLSNLNHSSPANDEVIDEQYFEKERLFLALYYNSIKETATQADRVTQAHKCVADSYLHIAQQLVRLAGIEVLPITTATKDPSRFLSCPMPSLTLPTGGPGTNNSTTNFYSPRNNNSIRGRHPGTSSSLGPSTSSANTLASSTKNLELVIDSGEHGEDGGLGIQIVENDGGNKFSGDKHEGSKNQKRAGNSLFDYQLSTNDILASIDPTSEGLKRLLLNVSDYLEQARKVEARIASDEDLKLTDILLYYKRDTVAAQELLMRRLRFLNEYETATKNLEKARQKGSRTATQYAEVIQKQARENFLSISKLAKQELIEYKQRRVASFRRSFTDLAELEMKHLKTNSQLIINCLNICRGLTPPQSQVPGQKNPNNPPNAVGVSILPSTSKGMVAEGSGPSSRVDKRTLPPMVDVPLGDNNKVSSNNVIPSSSTTKGAQISSAKTTTTSTSLASEMASDNKFSSVGVRPNSDISKPLTAVDTLPPITTTTTAASTTETDLMPERVDSSSTLS